MIDGHQPQVQVVTVPGHKSLEPRRAHILHTADVVVLVCDSAAAGPDSAREMLDSLREHLGHERAPRCRWSSQASIAGPGERHVAAGARRRRSASTYDTPVVGAQASAGIPACARR